jgi:hypothetical protein
MTKVRVVTHGFLLFVGSLSALILGAALMRAQQLPSAGQARLTIPIYRVYLDRGGCQPAVLKPKNGTFILSVVNVSFTQTLNAVLHPTGTSVSNAAVAIATNSFSIGQTRWAVQVNLANGSYLIEETNSTEHHCSIVVP